MSQEVYSVVISGNLAGQFVQNVMHVGGDNAGDRSPFAEADDIARTLIDDLEFWTFWLSCLPADYRALSMRVRRVKPVGAPTIIIPAPTGSPGLGARTGEISTFQAGPVLDLYNVAYSGRVGKIFGAGISESDISKGAYTSGFVTAVDTNWVVFFTTEFALSLSGDTFRWGILGKFGSVYNFLPTSDARLSLTVGTQRRRELPTA